MNPARQQVAPASTRSGRGGDDASCRRVVVAALGLCLGMSTQAWAGDPQPAQAVNLQPVDVAVAPGFGAWLPEQWTPNAKGSNYLLHGTFRLADKLEPGLNGGISRNQGDLANTSDFKADSKVMTGPYYALIKSVTLSFEFNQTRSKDFAGNTSRTNGASSDGFLIF
ncbi:MAG TPA: hypothetical protein VFE77_03955 [Rhodanobacter sp.]|nr:hypothetical protein [Rhodanobacter sp.]